jgi:4'-phosphopantetheinyl transferase
LARAESRRQFIVGRSVLRRVLGRCLDVAPHAVRIVHSAAGKPALAPGGADLRFSLSHAGDLVLLALARTLDVGVDAERMRDDLPLDRIADRVLDEQVKAVLNAQAAEARTLAFFHAWTQREAIVKAVGGRLFTTADPLAFHWPRPSRAVLRARGDGEASALAPLWTVIVPPLDGAHVATAVVAGEIERVQLWSLTP